MAVPKRSTAVSRFRIGFRKARFSNPPFPPFTLPKTGARPDAAQAPGLRQGALDTPFDSGSWNPWRRRLTPIALVLAWLLTFDAAAEVFRWVDDQGSVHYGDSPPQGQGAETIRTSPPPPASAVLQSRRRLDGLRDSKGAAEREKTREQEERAAVREERARRGRCRDAQRRLAVLQREMPVFQLDERGNRVYLEDDERAARRERAQKTVKTDCR